MKYKLLLVVNLFFLSLFSSAQDTQPVQFSFDKAKTAAGEFELKIKAKPAAGIQLFSTQKISEDLPVNTIINFDTAAKIFLRDSIKESGTLKTTVDATLNNATIKYFTDSVEWVQKIKLNKGDSTRIIGSINYYYKKGESIESGEQRISMQFQYNADDTAAIADVGNSSIQSKSLWGLLLAGIAAGLIGFLTPCVYALVPITVSFFTKRSKTKSQGKVNALFYSLCIILIYTLVGALVATVLPKNALNNLSTNWIFNIFLFVLFIIFGISFLGAFEINLPSSWSNKIDSKAGIGSYSGIFFMALTLVVVSFSCTGNFVASLLGLSTAAGKLAPIIGMLGFGLGLALPFAVFAFFPALLSGLGKSGGWQNALKVVLGFLELALALKFLSNADLDKGWRILDREVFIVLWVVIFVLMGIYLLGKIKFKHDSESAKNDFGVPYVSVSRLILAIASLSFALYLIPGLWGAPLKAVSAFVPPMGTQDFIANGGGGSNVIADKQNNSAVASPQKYITKLKKYEPLAAINNNLTIYYDYAEALAAAKILKKPVMLDFTGIQCVNCREFESKIWIDNGVGQRMKNDFIIASLFCDYNEELPDNEKRFSKLLNTTIETVGDKNEDLQAELIQASGQPNYVFVDGDGKLLVQGGYGYDATKGPKEFIAHLDKVKEEFKKRFP
ncbi:MAG: thioredoxin fold domain-containing protein [Ferruginibacter sp.]|nr:thioredoxin fold domain-containing protein [Ferruginibacter sp.]